MAPGKTKLELQNEHFEHNCQMLHKLKNFKFKKREPASYVKNLDIKTKQSRSLFINDHKSKSTVLKTTQIATREDDIEEFKALVILANLILNSSNYNSFTDNIDDSAETINVDAVNDKEVLQSAFADLDTFDFENKEEIKEDEPMFDDNDNDEDAGMDDESFIFMNRTLCRVRQKLELLNTNSADDRVLDMISTGCKNTIIRDHYNLYEGHHEKSSNFRLNRKNNQVIQVSYNGGFYYDINDVTVDQLVVNNIQVPRLIKYYRDIKSSLDLKNAALSASIKVSTVSTRFDFNKAVLHSVV